VVLLAVILLAVGRCFTGCGSVIHGFVDIDAVCLGFVGCGTVGYVLLAVVLYDVVLLVVVL
jgi:hypothetical protein